MSTPVPSDPNVTAESTTPPPTVVASPDPLTGEPNAHPVQVGVGASMAGAAGAAIGAVLGPVGMLVGAAFGAIAGGLAGHEVGSAPADPDAPVSLDKPLPTASSGLITPDESSIFADSTSADSGVTGEAPLMTESALPAAFATYAEPGEQTSLVQSSPAYATHVDTEETIRTTAYYRYLDRDAHKGAGNDFDDWIAAEKDVLQR